MAPRIRVGIDGWNHPEWIGLAYPADAKPADFLVRYAERFPIVEAASSYYGMPKTETVRKWAEATPDSFEMSLKVPDWILKRKPDDPELPRILDVFLTHMGPLIETNKLGKLVAQFHPQFRREKNAERLAAFVALLSKDAPWAVELRHDSWWRDETYDMLRDAGVTLVWSWLGGEIRTPPVRTTDALHLRLFGDRELEEPFDAKRRDARAELELWAKRVRDVGPEVKEVRIFVSKYLEGYAPATAATLCELLDLAPPEVGPLTGRAAGATPAATKPDFPTTWRF